MVTSKTGTEKAEVFNPFFASVFNMDDGPRGSQCPDLEDHDCKHDQLPVKPGMVQGLLLQMDPYKSMVPHEIHPKFLKELADVIIKSLSIIFETSWESGDIPAEWKLANIDQVFKKGKKEDPGNYRHGNLSQGPEKIILGSIEKHLKDNAVTGHSQHTS
ncbi:rna-directed dna polymerase from mobile element jockey-like [Pitangus sulphuratus]|nr:rna-directed dna polymerase from mobile element jockey-like [Pitangus sulphuratus]